MYDEYTLFLSFDDAIALIEKENSKSHFNRNDIVHIIDFFNRIGILSLLDNEGTRFFWMEDFLRTKNCLLLNLYKGKMKSDANSIDFDTFYQTPVFFSESTYALITESDLAFGEYPLLKNVILVEENDCFAEFKSIYFKGVKISTKSIKLWEYLSELHEHLGVITECQSSLFANSAYYMGNKKNLASFLISSIAPWSNKSMCILDLMCGSGAASNAFCQFWDVIASDAQEFCTILASIQGGIETTTSASKILGEISFFYNENFNALIEQYGGDVELEDSIFHMDYDSTEERNNQDIYIAYTNYMSKLWSYRSDLSSDGKQIYCEIGQRKMNTRLFPYCLFSSYFANTYFGLMQAIQIDSLRYAIEQLNNDSEKRWALGALIVTCSISASSHGGHFAQPIKVTQRNISKILTKRKRSILREFSKRLEMLITEGKKLPHRVQFVNGPWENTIKTMMSQNRKNLFVYVDAPYKREEYSRYYHLLETLVKYDYPKCEGVGRISSKKDGERFSSDFFTHSQSKVNDLFVNIFSSILSKGWRCGWSYSNNGVGSMVEIISRIHKLTNCKVNIYQVPYFHKMQGAASKSKSKKQVIEYFVLLSL